MARPYTYNDNDSSLLTWIQNFTSRIGDGSGDPEEAYHSTTKLIAELTGRGKPDAAFLDIGCGYGRRIQLLREVAPKIVALEPDPARFQAAYNCCHDGERIRVLNLDCSTFKRENPELRFDFITVSMVLQHVSTSVCDQICRDVHDFLLPSGVAIIATTLQDQERFTSKSNITPLAATDYDRYADDCSNQNFGIPVRQFSKASFLETLNRAELAVVKWEQFCYVLPEKLNWMAEVLGTTPEAIADLGTSQYAVVLAR